MEEMEREKWREKEWRWTYFFVCATLFTQMVILQIQIDWGWVIIMLYVYLKISAVLCSINIHTENDPYSWIIHTNGKQNLAGACVCTSKVVGYTYIRKKCVYARSNKCMNVCECNNFLPPKKMPCARNMDERRNEKEVASIIIGHMHYTHTLTHSHNTHSMRTWSDSCMPFILAAFCHLFLFYMQRGMGFFTDYPVRNCVLRLYFFFSF